jgi:hypothetical protein
MLCSPKKKTVAAEGESGGVPAPTRSLIRWSPTPPVSLSDIPRVFDLLLHSLNQDNTPLVCVSLKPIYWAAATQF